jgi:TonB family protein
VARARSALIVGPFRPTWEIGASLGIHVGLIGMMWIGSFLDRNTDPLFDPRDVMLVSAVALPKSLSRLPQRRERAPDPVRGHQKKADAPPIPPTASDMVRHDEDAKKHKGETRVKDRTSDRADLLNKLKRDDLLRDLTAPEGTTDRSLTDPNGVDPKDAVIGPVGSGRHDPVLGRYVAACTNRIKPNWRPLPSTIAAHPEFEVRVMVLVDAKGTITKPRVLRGSGDSAFDRSAITAVMRTAKLPPPPPRYVAAAAQGVTITLAARDLL